MRLRIVENLADGTFWVQERRWIGWWAVSLHHSLEDAQKTKAKLEALGRHWRVVGE